MVSEAGRVPAATMVTGFEVTGLEPVMQLLFEVMSQVTTSPFAGDIVRPGLFVPAAVPFTFHRYPGAGPPLTGEAVKFTELPVQKGLVSVEISTLAGSALLTNMVTGKEVTGLLLTQVALDVSLHVITSPLAGVYEKAGKLNPTPNPFTIHW